MSQIIVDPNTGEITEVTNNPLTKETLDARIMELRSVIELKQIQLADLEAALAAYNDSLA